MNATVEREMKKLTSAAEKIDNSAPIQVPDLEVGDMIPQGDIGLLRIDRIPAGATAVEWNEGDLQLAPGNTQGSRHCIPAKYRGTVKVFRVSDNDRLSDLCLRADAPFDLTHPEHAHHIGYAPGEYRVLHQQTSQGARVQD